MSKICGPLLLVRTHALEQSRTWSDAFANAKIAYYNYAFCDTLIQLCSQALFAGPERMKHRFPNLRTAYTKRL